MFQQRHRKPVFLQRNPQCTEEADGFGTEGHRAKVRQNILLRPSRTGRDAKELQSGALCAALALAGRKTSEAAWRKQSVRVMSPVNAGHI